MGIEWPENQTLRRDQLPQEDALFGTDQLDKNS